jgi:hypothetical protein
MMPATTLPFVCSRCGHNYGDSPGGAPLLIADGSSVKNLTLEMGGIRMPCPRCGQVNRPALPDGVYNAGGGRWQLVRLITEDLTSAQAARDDFAKLVRLVRAAEAEGRDASEVADVIAAETPFHRLAETISKHPNITSNVIAVIVSVVTAFIIAALHVGSSPAPAAPVHLTQQQINEIAEKVAHQLEKDGQQEASSSVGHPPAREGPARNKPCYCGSGIKYKKCCGLLKSRN